MGLVKTWRDDSVIWVQLARPEKANALSTVLVEELLIAIDAAGRDKRNRVLVLCGEGRTFCGGFDLSDLDHETDASLAYRFLRTELLLQAVAYSPLYTVGLAHGKVAGAGADLIAACRKRIGAPDSMFRFPGGRFGIVLGTRRLQQAIGERAYSVVLEQEQVEAEAACDISLLHLIADQDQWSDIVKRLERKVSELPRSFVQQVMQLEAEPAQKDLALLARSVAAPGLQERIKKYRESVMKK